MSSSLTPMEQAVISCNNQLQLPVKERLSLRHIAEDFGITRSTLSNRVRGATLSRSEAHSHHQALSDNAEAILVACIRCSSLMGHPPAPNLVFQLADKIH